MLQPYYDIIIVGSGAAGLGVALSLPVHFNIAIISKADLAAGSSAYAQGGIAAVMDQNDSFDEHIADTIRTGAGLCDPATVRFTVENGKKAIQWLMDHGVRFSREQEDNQFHLNQEGGHSCRRLVHVADRTGQVIVNRLLDQVQQRANIHCFADITAIDLLVKNKQCVGLTVIHNKQQVYQNIFAKAVVLATGGANSVYLRTTNTDLASGDGIAMAWRAGCRIVNLEFIQFHPTCLFHEAGPPILISEAVRGEGGRLVLADGSRFMLDYDPRAELASRDIVSRAIANVLHKHQLNYVYLDIAHKPAEDIKRLFPTIFEKCLAHGIDITRDRIPITPAAHYTCGGVATDLAGQTDIANLYAIGEVAHTGLHGANRIGSNSLLECVVFAANCAKALCQQLTRTPTPYYNNHASGTSTTKVAAKFDIAARIKQLRHLMSTNVGIIRQTNRLIETAKTINHLTQHTEALFDQSTINKELIELRNLVCVAKLIVNSALARHESRGAHYNVDYPQQNKVTKNTVLQFHKELDTQLV